MHGSSKFGLGFGCRFCIQHCISESVCMFVTCLTWYSVGFYSLLCPFNLILILLFADSQQKKCPAMPGSPVDAKIHSRSAPSNSTSSNMPPLPSVNPSGPRPASFSTTACKGCLEFCVVQKFCPHQTSDVTYKLNLYLVFGLLTF